LSVGAAYLTLSTSEVQKELFLGTGSYWTIGRGSDNTFVIHDATLSRRHAVIQQMQGGEFYFIDMGSRNGSSINGRRVTIPLELHDGDALSLGETLLTFHSTVTAQVREESQPHFADATVAMYSRNLITVLVVDIRDFTPLAQQLDEAILAQTIGTWFREAGTIVRRHGCSGDKYIGDAVMAVWSHPTEKPKTDEMFRILQALAEIQTFTSSLHKQFDLPAPIRIGAGINTGLSTMGNSGGQDSPDFSPLGESVNAAFRLETATKKSGMDVALGERTFQLLGDSLIAVEHFEPRAVELKGYKKAVDAWFTTFEKLNDLLCACNVKE
jgi:adenylate cyclase